MEQQIAYCTTPDGVRIAYATYGNDGAPPLMHLPDIPFQEAIWASPWGRAFFQELARHRRLITLDARGYGASQRETDCSRPDPLLADVAAVADHLRLDRFELFSEGIVLGTPAVMYAGAHPGRVSKLVLFSPTIASSPSGVVAAESVRASYPIFLWALATLCFPSGPPEMQRWFSTAVRASVSAETFAATLAWTYDLAPILPRVEMPVLILHRQRAQTSDLAQVRSVASLIPGARLVTLDGDTTAPYWDHEQYIDIVYDFLGIERGTQTAALPSGMTAILFADIADSTLLTEMQGDVSFRDRSRGLDASLRAALRDAGGTPIEGKVLGDGVMATFPSAVQAIDAVPLCLGGAADRPRAAHRHSRRRRDPRV
jgi:pimeloyl-ACP methyl ester carboxylesterase